MTAENADGFSELVNVSTKVKGFDICSTNIINLSQKNLHLLVIFISAPTKFRVGRSEIQRVSDLPPSEISEVLENTRYSLILKFSHRALEMSDFDVQHGTRKKIVCTFRFYYRLSAHTYLYTCSTQKAHQ